MAVSQVLTRARALQKTQFIGRGETAAGVEILRRYRVRAPSVWLYRRLSSGGRATTTRMLEKVGCTGARYDGCVA